MHTAVSVIIPTYNRASLVGRAVRSALAAMEPGDELIVVDDGSTDETMEVLAGFGERIHCIRTPNRGVGPARNEGIRAARHPFVAFLDSDDEWVADKLRLQRAFLQARPEVVFAFGDFRMVDERGRVHPRYLYEWHRVDRSWAELLGPGEPYSSTVELPAGCEDLTVYTGDLYPALMEGPFVAAWTALVRRELAGEAFRFAEDLPICEEWACFAALARRGPAAFFDRDIAINHGHSGVRVTNTAGSYGYMTGRIIMTERTWGRDPGFLATHGDRYREMIAELYLQRARWLLGQGRVKEARSDLELVSRVPTGLRMLANLPASTGVALRALRRAALLAGSLAR